MGKKLMTFYDWVRDTKRRFDEEPVGTAINGSVQELWVGALRRFGDYVWNYGDHVYENDWDVLLVLDTCRWDVLSEVSEDYSFLEDYDPESDYISSVGSRSPEWVKKTFNNSGYSDELRNTAYVTANPHSKDIDAPEQLQLFDEVWKYGWDSSIGNVPPETMTDRAISVMRNHDPDRLIVHYMQPHQPYRKFVEERPDWFGVVGSDEPWNPNKGVSGELSSHKVIWERLRDGEVSFDEMWDAYRDNLRWVLESIEPIQENMNADEIVITADHGEAFGEWGCYGHESHVPIKELKRVPWATFSGEDTGEYSPSISPPEDGVSVSDSDRKERLRSLGYM